VSELFDDPVAAPMGDRPEMKIFVNKLVIVRPKLYEASKITIHKPDGGEAVFANIALLEPHEGESYKVFRNVLIMQGYLVGDFKGSLGRNLLGSIYLGPKTKGLPPFMFKSLKGNPKAVEIATAWMAAHEAELLADPDPVFDEPGNGRSTLDTMRAESNPWAEEPPF
jgi:hypothetical protein